MGQSYYKWREGNWSFIMMKNHQYQILLQIFSVGQRLVGCVQWRGLGWNMICVNQVVRIFFYLQNTAREVAVYSQVLLQGTSYWKLPQIHFLIMMIKTYPL